MGVVYLLGNELCEAFHSTCTTTGNHKLQNGKIIQQVRNITDAPIRTLLGHHWYLKITLPHGTISWRFGVHIDQSSTFILTHNIIELSCITPASPILVLQPLFIYTTISYYYSLLFWWSRLRLCAHQINSVWTWKCGFYWAKRMNQKSRSVIPQICHPHAFDYIKKVNLVILIATLSL